MSNPKVTVGGTPATDVVSVNYDRQSIGSISTATITVGNTPTNRSLFQPGSDVLIEEEDPNNPGTYVKRWSGEVNGKPSTTSNRNLTLDVEAEGYDSRLEYAKVRRTFTSKTTGEIIEEAVEKERDPSSSTEYLHTGSATSGWSSNADIFRLLDTDSGMADVGNNAVFGSISEGSTGTYHAEYTDVFDVSVPAGQIERFDTRVITNNSGSVFDTSVVLVDAGGNRYEWDVPAGGSGEFETHQLAIEDATITETDQDPKVRHNFAIDGELPEDRAFAIDYDRVVPFDVLSRDIGVGTSVDDTDFKMTRRVRGSIMEVVEKFASEDGASAYVDPDGILQYFTEESRNAPVSIDYNGDSNVVEVKVDRDYDVRNRVTVEGKDDISASFEDTSSIQFYNERAPKEEPINDGSLRTRRQLRRRARAFLDDNAWEDGSLSFTVADPKFRDVNPGDIISVLWPPEDIDGNFEVSSVSRTAEGYTNVNLTGTVSV